MTLMSSISKLTTSVDQLTGEANVTKAALDAKVAQAAAEVVSAQAEQALAEGYRATTATHAADAATHLATVKAGVTYQGIAAILASKAVSAVDVFVYDTSLDSDGGAWRKRCQHTSWYNEALNTSTRGSRREFPAVAVIVAEAGKVTIYDGDDPALPMWMVFEPFEGTNAAQVIFRAGGSGAHKSLAAINGVLTAGMTQTANYAGGLRYVRFIADDAYYHDESSAATDGRFNGNIARRNEPLGFSKVSNWPLIVNRRCNDVAMTVLPDAPIDPATGLPVPTIYAFTEGGVSRIGHDGQVSSTASSPVYGGGVFNDRVWAGSQIGGQSYFGSLPVKDELPTGGSLNVAYYWRPVGQNSYDIFFDGQAPQFAERSFAASQGAVFFQLNPFDNRLSMSSLLTSTHATGWMPGAIKGAWLADTDEGDLIEATFADDFTFYADQAAAEAASWSFIGTEFDAGLDAIVFNGTGSANATLSGITLSNAGITDRFEVTVVVSGVTAGSISVQENFVPIGSFAASGTYAFRGVRAGSFRFVTANGFDGAIENVTFKALDADRSVNNKGLVVSGSITRSPVADGAELVAYAGFSASNYLETTLSNMPAGNTDDLCMMGWFKPPNGSTGIYAGLDIPTSASSGAGVFGITKGWANGSSGAWAERGTSVGGNFGKTTVIPNQWQHVAAVRSSTGTKLYVNGKLESSTGVAIATSTTPTLRAGGALDGSGSGGLGSIALLRISATAPTADQIAKIYEDERKLFQPGAQCTLYGTSDVVTALAHDPKTNLLHVGTSAGRSTFDGLQRVANTETPVGTAISAVNGLIAEQ